MPDRMEVRVPDIGDFTDVEIIDVLVKEGDEVAAEDPLITLETDKASMDVPTPQAGKVVGLAVQKGGRVSEGDVIVTLEIESAGSQEEPAGQSGEGEQAPTPEPAPAQAKSAPEPKAGRAARRAQGRREVAVPDIGDFQSVEIIEVHVQPGDTVAAEDPLITLESDKAAMDVPSPAAGKVVELKVGKGDRVSEGDVVLILEGGDAEPEGDGSAPTEERRTAEARAEPEPEPEEEPTEAAAAPASGGDAGPAATVEGAALPAVGEFGFARAHAGPSVRKLARELGVDLSRVRGSGVKGRITHEDVKGWVKSTLERPAAAVGAALPAVPEVDFSKFGATELQPLSRVQRIAGPRLHASWVNLPHVTQFDEADITEMEETRKDLKKEAERAGARLTPLAFILRACVKALMEFPQFNSSLHPDGQQLVVKKYYNIGFAVDTPGGLVVPVVKELDGKTLLRVASELGELSEKARTGKLAAADMQGGNFTVSSLGSLGGTYFTPIINAPEVAILGVSRAYLKPVWEKKKFVPRLTLPLSLSYDHRVIDGALAVRFTRFLAEILSDVDRLLA